MCAVVVGPTLSALHAAAPYQGTAALLGNFYTARGLILPDAYRDLSHTRRVSARAVGKLCVGRGSASASFGGYVGLNRPIFSDRCL
jgi:hypothetical protein